jgi:hypothetical protein
MGNPELDFTDINGNVIDTIIIAGDLRQFWEGKAKLSSQSLILKLKDF